MSNWPTDLSEGCMTSVLQAAQRDAWLDNHPAIIFHDLDLMRARLQELHALFPRQSLHALAIKANPLVELLRTAVDSGAGLEAASWEEVQLAITAGCAPERIVYDSPAKSVHDLQRAIQLGIWLNADSWDELTRIAELAPSTAIRSGVGLRINPLVGEGTIASTSVAGPESRFGVPLHEAWESAAGYFQQHPWLCGLHVHVGSQGCSLDQLVDGVQRIMALRHHVHSQLQREVISVIDIGGGLPAAIGSESGAIPPPPLAADYVARLKQSCPSLFDTNIRIITEFGRAVQAPCGWAVSRIEYVKRVNARLVAVVHLGADFMMRQTYQPGVWDHRYLILAANGLPKTSPKISLSIAGPLCFTGDMLIKQVELPEPEAGDLLVIRDVGAYCLGTWSRHCSRGIPVVLGYESGGVQPRLRILRRRETPEDIARFWSATPFFHADR